MDNKELLSQYLAILAYSLVGDSAKNLLESASKTLKDRPWLNKEHYFEELTEQIVSIQQTTVKLCYCLLIFFQISSDLQQFKVQY